MILSLVNQKGGVGKTTTAVSLTAALTQLGKRVLLCDFDPQANATSGLGVEKHDVQNTIYDVIINAVPVKSAIVHTKFGDLLPSGAALAGAGIELVSLDRREFRLKDALEPLSKDYDFILIDCPPSLELLTLNALCAADQVVIPVQCEYYALEGLSDLMTTLRAVKRAYRPDIAIFGLVLTMYDGRTNLSMQVAQEVRRHFPGKVFTSVIPRNVRLSEAPSHGLPITAYDRAQPGGRVISQSGSGNFEKIQCIREGVIMAKSSQKGLGKGLGALFSEAPPAAEAPATPNNLPIQKLEPNPRQPRKDFDEAALAELADSISQHGLIQPITVRPLDTGYYQIIAGDAAGAPPEWPGSARYRSL